VKRILYPLIYFCYSFTQFIQTSHFEDPTEIFEFIFLGSAIVAHNPQILKLKNIYYVLNVAGEVLQGPKENFKQVRILIEDLVDPLHPQYATFEETFQLIDKALEEKKEFSSTVREEGPGVLLLLLGT